MTEYRALVVDFGGVLTTSITTSFAAFCLETGVRPDRLSKLVSTAYVAAGESGVPAADMHDLIRGVETGRIDVDEFDRRLAAALSEGLARPVEPAGLTARLFEQLRPDDRMRAAVRRAHEHGLKTCLLSNTWGPPGRGASEYESLFDAIVRSHEAGIRKPDAAIYLLAADRLGVEPKECVFVDDVPANVDGARAVGMAGVLHKDAAITIPKLEELFGIPLSHEDSSATREGP